MSYTDGGTSVDKPDDWRELAACLGVDSELFFPIGKSPEAKRQAREAKSVCWDLCPVRAECNDFAMTIRPDGIWGGYDEDDRTAKAVQWKAARRRQRRQEETGVTPAPYVPAGPTREALERAQDAGYGVRDMWRATGIGEAVIRGVLAGQARVMAGTEAKALAAVFYRIGANA